MFLLLLFIASEMKVARFGTLRRRERVKDFKNDLLFDVSSDSSLSLSFSSATEVGGLIFWVTAAKPFEFGQDCDCFSNFFQKR